MWLPLFFLSRILLDLLKFFLHLEHLTALHLLEVFNVTGDHLFSDVGERAGLHHTLVIGVQERPQLVHFRVLVLQLLAVCAGWPLVLDTLLWISIDDAVVDIGALLVKVDDLG